MERKCWWGFSYIAEGFGTIGPAGRSCWRSSERRSHHDQTSFTAGSVTAVDGRPVLLVVARRCCCCWWKMIRTTCCWSSLGDDTVGGRFLTGGCCRQRVGWTHIGRSFLLQEKIEWDISFSPKLLIWWPTKCEEDNVSRDKGSATGGVSIEWASTWTDWLMTFLESPDDWQGGGWGGMVGGRKKKKSKEFCRDSPKRHSCSSSHVHSRWEIPRMCALSVLPALLLFNFSLKLVDEPRVFLFITFWRRRTGDAPGNKPHTHVSLCSW